jgi:peptidoglycan/xylan/chitin deacetylase (PgdA/CDA1 family)
VKIVYAHYVGASVPHLAAFGTAFDLDRLDEHLTVLGRSFQFASLSEVLEDNGSGRADSSLLAVTFDDGFDLIAGGAVEVLNAHGVKATTFVLTSTLDNRELMWRNKLSAIRELRAPETYLRAYNRLMEKIGSPAIAHASAMMAATMRWDMGRKDELADELWAACDMPPLDEFLDAHRPYFTRERLRRWIADGHAVGLHTATHPDCSRLDADGLRAEILEPARQLCAELGLPSLFFSYPFGRRCRPEHEALLDKSSVLRCALGVRGFSRRGTSPMRLERASIEGDMRFAVYGKAFVGRPRSS